MMAKYKVITWLNQRNKHVSSFTCRRGAMYCRDLPSFGRLRHPSQELWQQSTYNDLYDPYPFCCEL